MACVLGCSNAVLEWEGGCFVELAVVDGIAVLLFQHCYLSVGGESPSCWNLDLSVVLLQLDKSMAFLAANTAVL